jgi:murein DD-endopeptidase MepM/ murein hydrolase activator NlpD
LWETLTELGEKEGLVMAMAEILQWDIDFTRVYEGDFFKLIVDKKFRHGELVKYGEIQAVQFNNAGKDFFGFRFVNPRDGKVGYFDQKGRSVRKAFLRVPFRFSPRISSGFSYNRLHPILKKRRPHLGLDFAAPKGTSVLASASGTVVVSGWNGGFGKFVKLRHGNGYQTSYGHLSRIRVKRGARVAQGQIIGNVGSTGLSTGAHLDYRVQDKRGVYLNPRKRIAWPSDRPVDKRYLDAYSAVRDGYSMQLEEGLYDQGKAEGFELAE